MSYFNFLTNLTIPKNFGTNWECEETPAITEVKYKIFDALKPIDIQWGLTKLVIIFHDYVIKIPFYGSFYEGKKFYNFEEYDDYCQLEEELYHDALLEGFSDFFVPIKKVGFCKNGVPFYRSDKVYQFYTVPRNQYIENLRAAEDIRFNHFTCFQNLPYLEWIAYCLNYYSKEEVIELIDFILAYKINDLHSSNVGRRIEGTPIILDYSGFYDN